MSEPVRVTVHHPAAAAAVLLEERAGVGTATLMVLGSPVSHVWLYGGDGPAGPHGGSATDVAIPPIAEAIDLHVRWTPGHADLFLDDLLVARLPLHREHGWAAGIARPGPFGLPLGAVSLDPAIAVLCHHVLRDGAPILEVRRDEGDGHWCCLCGGEHTEKELKAAARVRFADVRSQDRSLMEVADLGPGGGARRGEVGGAWQRVGVE